jgi:hypothetical protein
LECGSGIGCYSWYFAGNVAVWLWLCSERIIGQVCPCSKAGYGGVGFNEQNYGVHWVYGFHLNDYCFALLWFGVGVVYTLVQFYGLQNKDIKPEIVNFCIAVIAAFVITLILRLIAAYRDKKTKAQQPVGESDVPIESKSKTLSRLIGMLEQNNENISKVIGLMNDEAKNE